MPSSDAIDYLLLRSNERSNYDDVHGEVYHYTSTVPNNAAIQPGRKAIVVSKSSDKRKWIVATAEIGDVTKESTDDGKTHFKADYTNYERWDPPVEFTKRIADRVDHIEPRYNFQNAIISLCADAFGYLDSLRKSPPEENLKLSSAATLALNAALYGGNSTPAENIPSLMAALMAKRLLILSGLSGSGKTRLGVGFAAWITENAKREDYVVQPVGSDWMAADSLLGYPDALDPKRYHGTETLELVLRAISDPEKPYVLVLDEMNLSHVERYFSPFLSSLETKDEPFSLHGGGEPKTAAKTTVPAAIYWPENLFVIGTINVDETTYQFSPKVLDRANVIEFRITTDEFGAFLEKGTQRSTTGSAAGKGAEFGVDFVARSAAELGEGANGELTLESIGIEAAFRRELMLFFRILQSHNLEFGYRVGREAERFLTFYHLLTNGSPEDVAEGEDVAEADWFNEAFDRVVIQKLLPKLNGSRSKLDPLLYELRTACSETALTIDENDDNWLDQRLREVVSEPVSEEDDESARKLKYPKSAAKLDRMIAMLDSGFASFAEA